jgi:ketosteroid isomerase-like protein
MDSANMNRAMEEEYMQLLATGDVRQLVTNFYAEGAKYLTPNHTPFVGRSAIQKALEELVAAGLSEFVLEAEEVELSGDFAYATGRNRLTIKLPSGAKIYEEGKYLVVYRRQDNGQWRAVADMRTRSGRWQPIANQCQDLFWKSVVQTQSNWMESHSGDELDE